MIGRHLTEGFARHRDRIALIHGHDQFTYGDIGELANGLVDAWSALSGQRVAVSIAAPASFVAAIAALDLLRSHAFLVGARRHEELQNLQDAFAWDRTIRDQDVQMVSPVPLNSLNSSSDDSGLVTILTSGTTGRPKAIHHSWKRLADSVRRDARYTGTRWLIGYPLTLYAGTQVLLHAMLNWATLVIPVSLDPGEVCRTLKDKGVTHASGTPTFWRQLVFFGSRDVLQGSKLEQITLGGEAATQELLDQLRLGFPQARIVHIYASTELGRLFSVTDGKEGFPAQFLKESPEEGVDLKVVDGELMVRGRTQMISCDGQRPPAEQPSVWTATGDLVEVCADRVLFKGRRNDVVNVGGRKVSPLKVESALRGLPGVVDVRVYAKKSSVTGHLVAADVVLAPGFSEETLGAELRRAATQALESYEIPRLVRVVPKLEISQALKVVRSEQVQ